MIEIRPLNKDDGFADLLSLSREFFYEYGAYHKDFFKIDTIQDGHIVDYFTRWRDHENGRVIVAVDGERIVGYITVYVAGQADYWAVKTVGHISGLMVQQEYRRKGIATALLAAAKKFFAEKAAKYYTVFTAVENRAALEFYARNGLAPLHTTMIGEVGILSAESSQ